MEIKYKTNEHLLSVHLSKTPTRWGVAYQLQQLCATLPFSFCCFIFITHTHSLSLSVSLSFGFFLFNYVQLANCFRT